VRLQVHPELRFHAEELPEPQRSVSGDATFALNDLVDAARRHADSIGKPVLAELQCPEEVFSELQRQDARDRTYAGPCRSLSSEAPIASVKSA